MKNILIAFLFLPLFGIGQEKQDTVKVVMLVCDTARTYFVDNWITYDTVINGIGHGKMIRDTTYRLPNKDVYWIFSIGGSDYELRNKKDNAA